MTITVPPCDSLNPERHNMQKILEVTKKMMELLTGEVSGAGNSGTFSSNRQGMCLDEGHKDLYKDVMMDNQPPLTSPDGSSHGNPPERCPQEIKEEEDEDGWGDGGVRASKSTQRSVPGHHGGVIQLQEPPERCPRPLYSRDSTQEGHTIPHHYKV
ncbi:unnamed protein product, partial [Staurois parvus]